MKDIKSKTINGVKWSAIERILTQGMQLVIMLVLARLLGPQAFGLIGMLAIFIAIAQVFVDSGFSSALIRKVNRTEIDYSTAFYFNIIIAILCYIMLYFGAGYIASFYGQQSLVPLARYMGVVVIINSFTVVPRTRLTVIMDFKTQAKASIVSVIISGVVSMILAKNGFGVWTLVTQTLLVSALNAVLINALSPWLPKLQFSLRSLKYLFGFGGKLLISGLLETTYNNIYQIIIGKKFEASQLGQFTQANQLSSIPAMTMTSIIQRVTYPMFSHIQNDSDMLEKSYLLTIKIAAVVIFPIMCGLSIIASPFISLFLGREWNNAAQLVMVLALGYMLYPMHAVNLNILQVKGRSDLFLNLEIVKKIIATIILLITLPFGILAMCTGLVIHSYLSLLINTYYTGKLTNLTLTRQLKAIWVIWAIAVFSSVITKIVMNYFFSDNLAQIFTALLLAPVTYIGAIFLLQRELFDTILSMRKN